MMTSEVIKHYIRDMDVVSRISIATALSLSAALCVFVGPTLGVIPTGLLVLLVLNLAFAVHAFDDGASRRLREAKKATRRDA